MSEVYLASKSMIRKMKGVIQGDDGKGNSYATIYGIPIYEHTRYKTVQKRTHRKRRVNLKWRKRYGTRQVEIEECLIMDMSLLDLSFRRLPKLDF